jgi:hypothetical protein
MCRRLERAPGGEWSRGAARRFRLASRGNENEVMEWIGGGREGGKSRIERRDGAYLPVRAAALEARFVLCVASASRRPLTNP